MWTCGNSFASIATTRHIFRHDAAYRDLEHDYLDWLSHVQLIRYYTCPLTQRHHRAAHSADADWDGHRAAQVSSIPKVSVYVVRINRNSQSMTRITPDFPSPASLRILTVSDDYSNG